MKIMVQPVREWKSQIKEIQEWARSFTGSPQRPGRETGKQFPCTRWRLNTSRWWWVSKRAREGESKSDPGRVSPMSQSREGEKDTKGCKRAVHLAITSAFEHRRFFIALSCFSFSLFHSSSQSVISPLPLGFGWFYKWRMGKRQKSTNGK